MLAFRILRPAFPKERIIRFSVGNLHLVDRTASVSTLAHTNSKPSPTTKTKNFNIATSRTHQISRHLSTQTPQKLEMSSLPISEKGYHANAPSGYSVRKNGAPNTLEHRIYIEKDGVPLSPFHDIPLYANEQQTILNMIVEIPRWTNAKMEVSDQPQGVLMLPNPHIFTVIDTDTNALDFQGRDTESNQTRYQEGQASLCPQLLSSQRLPLELRGVPSGMSLHDFPWFLC